MMQTKGIIAASVVSGFCFLTIMALVTRLLTHKHNKQVTNDVQVSEGSIEHDHQLQNISTSWKRIFAPKQRGVKGQWVPTLSGITKAGDEAFFSSTLFANLHGHPGDLSVQVLYELFANELRSRPAAERSAYAGDISRFVSTSKRVTGGPKRVQSMSHRAPNRGRGDGPTMMQRKSLDLSAAERGFARSMSIKRPSPTLVPMRNGCLKSDQDSTTPTSWMKDGQIVESRHGRFSIKITAAELTALSVILGSPLTMDDKKNLVGSQKGAFNISLLATATENEKYEVDLQRHKQSTSHMPAQGSGFSPLFAKHLAAGSLPYGQDKKSVRSVLITFDTLRAVETGSQLQLQDCSSKTPQYRYLTSLPSSRGLNLQTAIGSTKPMSSNHVIDAIGMMPFVGGLVPLASMPLVKTVQFVASGGLPAVRLLQRLEGLVERVNKHAPNLNTFGPLYEPHHAALLYRERERLGRLATSATSSDSIADKASRMQRYVTLLERLMALVPDLSAQDVLEAVQAATRKELERSYDEALATHQKGNSIPSSATKSYCLDSDSRTKRFSTQSHYQSKCTSDVSELTITSPVSSTGFAPLSLGKQAEQILKADLPLSVDQVALVARLVLVAWTLSVDVVAWEEGEHGFRIPNLVDLPEKMVLC
jgi:hypothetical protein